MQESWSWVRSRHASLQVAVAYMSNDKYAPAETHESRDPVLSLAHLTSTVKGIIKTIYTHTAEMEKEQVMS